MKKKYYNFETRFISLRDNLREYLKNNNIYYELSGAYSFYHFEVLASEEDVAKINTFLDTITINEEWYMYAYKAIVILPCNKIVEMTTSAKDYTKAFLDITYRTPIKSIIIELKEI